MSIEALIDTHNQSNFGAMTGKPHTDAMAGKPTIALPTLEQPRRLHGIVPAENDQLTPLDALAERGGLSWLELLLVISDKPLYGEYADRFKGKTEAEIFRAASIMLMHEFSAAFANYPGQPELRAEVTDDDKRDAAHAGESR